MKWASLINKAKFDISANVAFLLFLTAVLGTLNAYADATKVAPCDGKKILFILNSLVANSELNNSKLLGAPEIKLIFSSSSFPSASANTDGAITISKGLCRILPNREQLAFVLGHEIAHLEDFVKQKESRKVFSANLLDDRADGRLQEELMADKRALELVEKAGYLASKAKTALMQLSNFGATSGLSLGQIYRNLAQRVAALEGQYSQREVKKID